MGERGIVLVGLNHRTAPVELRERLAFENGDHEQALRRLMAVEGVAEGAIVSTMNRVEVVACGASPESLGAALPGYLAREHGVSEAALGAHLYTHVGRDAVRHLFRVAASLDSMVVGEPQILGQMKEQYAAAAASGASGRVLHRCFHKSFSVAKRVRSETGIAEKAVSIGSAAVALARRIFDRLEDQTALLIGAGTMGELTARQLLSGGVGSVMVTNRTFDRAVEVAPPPGRHAGPMGAPHALPAARGPGDRRRQRRRLPSRRARGRAAVRERRRRSIFFIDLAVPRCIDPAVNQIDGVYLYDIDDLEGVSSTTRRARGRR
jgi:glutamyl-tRNA reductase